MLCRLLCCGLFYKTEIHSLVIRLTVERKLEYNMPLSIAPVGAQMHMEKHSRKSILALRKEAVEKGRKQPLEVRRVNWAGSERSAICFGIPVYEMESLRAGLLEQAVGRLA